jgi:predicted metal-dependent phosphoesterase TrpH
MKVIVFVDHDALQPDQIEINAVMVDPVLYAKKNGMKLIPGIEFSCEIQVEDVHIVVFL